ncbi:hypothetical protein RHO12_01675 [Orbus sturtevantii]|uniref:ParB family protein n=1 Tax=Orbus sturtevantii TaxID=3074109 RepID=UPI00370D26F3
MTNIAKKSSTDILNERISAGFPGGVDRATQKIDMNEMPMKVTIDQLSPSEVLPRFKRNALYDDIKSSIREKGLDQPPVITKMPGKDGYVISDGGNTRLQILKELYEETGEKRFYTINCLFRPWKGEIKSIIGHLTENGLRDDFTFIEKAVGVSKSKALYERELGKSLSSRELSDRFKKDGYPISFQLISKMLNTMEYLYPYIPEILKQGLSRNQIEKILTLRAVCEDLYQRSGKFIDDTAFVEGFNLVLSGFDLEPELFNYDHLQDEMFGYFARALNIKYNVFEFQLQEKNHNGKPLPPIDVRQPVPVPTHIATPQGSSTEVKSSHAAQPPSDKSETVKPSITEPTTNNLLSQVSRPHNGSDEPSMSSFASPALNSGSEEGNDATELPYTLAANGDIIAKAGADIQEVVKSYAANTDFSKMFPKDFSITVNLNTFGGSEKMPILDIWKLTENMTTHEYIFSDIAGHVLDILRELRIDAQAMAPFSIDRPNRITVMGFNPLTDEEEQDSKKQTAHQILVSLLTDKNDNKPIHLNYLITEFNDFIVIKFLRIIRLKRVYDTLLGQFLSKNNN